jgi:cytochrome c
MRPAMLRLALALLLSLVAAAALVAGDASRGEILYEGCQDCHSLDKNEIGPKHRGVFGRKAGSLPDYAYSDALKASGVVWDDKTLDRWLADPQAFLPGSKMFYHLEAEQDRADVIEFLKTRAK